MRLAYRISVYVFCALISGCDSPEEKARQYVEKGEAFLGNGDPVKARLEFKNALQINDQLAPAWYGLARVAKQDSDWSEAFSLLDRVVESDPGNLDAHIEQVRLLLGAGQLERALGVSTASLQLAPDDARVLALRAAIIYTLEDIEGAADLAHRALAADPGNSDALLVLATERLERGNLSEALEYLDRGIAHDEKNVALQLIKVEALNRLDRSGSSERVLEHLIELYPETDAFHYLLAHLYLSQSKVDDAERVYRDLIVVRGGDSRAQMELIRLLNRTRGPAVAIAELEKLLAEEPASTDLRFLMVQLQHRIGDREGVGETLEVIADIATSVDSKHKALGLLAAFRLENGQYDQAMMLVDTVLSEDPRDEQALLIQSYRQIEQRQLSEAVSNLRRILNDDPDSTRALFLLGKAHELAGMRDLAEDRYFRAFEVGGQSPQFGLPLAKYLIKLQRPHRAAQVVEDVLGAYPENIESLILLARIRIISGDWSGAHSVVDRIRVVDEQIGYEVLGSLYAAQSDNEKSIDAFRRAYQISPDTQGSMNALVAAYLRAGKPDEAHDLLDSVISAQEDSTAARLLKGQVYLSEGKERPAIRSFSQVLKREPANTAAYQYLSLAKSRLGAWKEALATLDRGLAFVPGDFNLSLAKAGLLENQRVFDEAIAGYEKLIDVRPNADIVANNLASLLSEHRDDHDSLLRAHELARRFQESEVPHFKDTLGWTYFRLGKPEDARGLIEDAVRETPAMPVFRYHLGMTYMALEEKELARRELQLALELTSGGDFPFRDDVESAIRRL
ncbi:tetratricopeptide repeat protein [Microbulbifer sp. ALW1]|uniref:tetratricopeptide repeat protein n=1 Tax=Microbulbifer sp. (strain ALW1) TaxID=1516059 RepID=UPI00135BC9A6|nr:tetratricopeptide repeat protein [Microbulbifer sp. ALW1]